jgi:hypothetical protein
VIAPNTPAVLDDPPVSPVRHARAGVLGVAGHPDCPAHPGGQAFAAVAALLVTVLATAHAFPD